MVSLSPTTTVYRLAGLRIASDLPLHGLLHHTEKFHADCDVVIRRASVPVSLSFVGLSFAEGQCNKDELLLNIPEVGRYLLRKGDEILVDPAPNASDGDLCAYLLGTVFGMLCHQRGITPLHASAIDVTDGCVAFVGNSGAGKSTLVAALRARGYQVICDDVCFLQLDERRQVRAWPGINRIRLWADALKALGCEKPGVEREFRGFNKYIIPLRGTRNPEQPRLLRRIYQLEAASDGAPPCVNPLHGASAVEMLLQNVYRLGLAEKMGHKPTAFGICAATARNVPAFRFSRPMGFNVLHKGIDFLEDHLGDLC